MCALFILLYNLNQSRLMNQISNTTFAVIPKTDPVNNVTEKLDHCRLFRVKHKPRGECLIQRVFIHIIAVFKI